MKIADVVKRSGLFQKVLAEDSDLSYDALRSWLKGRREPQPDSVEKLADGLERRSQALSDLAAELRGEAAGDEG